MDETTLIGILVTLIGALGLKEIWNIWKKKIDIQGKKDLITLSRDHKILHEVIGEQRNIIEDMTKRIIILEEKIDQLIEENRDCAIKLARMEERLLLSAKKSSARKQKSNKNGATND
tara:strand:- start:2084 stop:2434 length:351 start_codon:yes stop_codon:yes gene_type:complete